MIRSPIRAVPGGDVTALRPAQGAVCSGSPEGRCTSPAGWAYDPPFPKPLREQGVRPHSWPLSTAGPTPAGVTCVLAGRVTRPDRGTFYRRAVEPRPRGAAVAAWAQRRRPVTHAAMSHGDHEGETRPSSGSGRGPSRSARGA